MLCLTVLKPFAGEPFGVSFFSIIDFFGLKSVMPRFSVEFFWSQDVEKIRRGTVLCFTKVLVSNFLWTGGEHHVL